jgi:hypothetical protein
MIHCFIENQRASYQPHAFRSGGTGMLDFNFLLPTLRKLNPRHLKPHLDHIDAIRMTHLDCRPCFFKALVYSILFSQTRLRQRHRNYIQLFAKLHAQRPPVRNYFSEVGQSLLKQAVLSQSEIEGMLAALPFEARLSAKV